MNEELLRPYIRAVTEEDKKTLPRFSYSRIEQYLNCPMAYDFKYNKNMHTKDTSLALELGSLLHAVLETKGYMYKEGEIDYNILDKLILDGIIETNEKTKEQLLGVEALKEKYWEIWYTPDSEGRTYDQKIEIFHKVLRDEMPFDSVWKPYAFEKPFSFVWDNRAIMVGFIDRLDIKARRDQFVFRTIDYKTSKKVFSQDKLPTSLQFGIYALACLADPEIEMLPVESVYRFILLDDMQYALTKGWEKRLIKKLTQVFDSIDERNKSGRWEPKPTPLCHWCFACKTNPDAYDFKYACEYYSLWTPENKTFDKNKEWNALKPEEPSIKRKLIF